MLPLRVWRSYDYDPLWLRSSAAARSLLAEPPSLWEQLVGDVQSHVADMERVRRSLLRAYPLLGGEDERSWQPRRSGRQGSEGAGQEAGAAGPAPGQEKFRLSMDVSGFSPAELAVRVDGRKVTVSGRREKRTESEAGVCSYEYRELRRETLLPAEVDAQAVLCSLSPAGQLCLEAPRVALPAAAGRAVPIRVCQEAAAGGGAPAPEGHEPGSCETETGGESGAAAPEAPASGRDPREPGTGVH
ncbi:heat shock protein 30C-like [Carettochelys insculpta]|uniref:heat shock protein 30C-like n=1 Tax=Carettochelys insculpta TaxID=44489 RepID=UPI003EBF0092